MKTNKEIANKMVKEAINKRIEDLYEKVYNDLCSSDEFCNLICNNTYCGNDDYHSEKDYNYCEFDNNCDYCCDDYNELFSSIIFEHIQTLKDSIK